MKPNCASCRLRFLIFTILTAAIVVNGLHAAEAQFLGQDTVRFLEQSTFGPTYDLIAHVQDIGFEAFLNEQAAAPMSHYPELPFWPQTRPTKLGSQQNWGQVLQYDKWLDTSTPWHDPFG